MPVSLSKYFRVLFYTLLSCLLCNYGLGTLSGFAADELGASPQEPSHDLQDLLELLEKEKLEKFELGELVPTASKKFMRRSDQFIVTADDILQQNARNVGDALRFVPGLIFSEGGTKNPKLSSIRGLGSRQYAVIIDGRPVYDPFFGDVDLNNLPIDNVAEIKVVKGPVAAAYGPNTFGGVINIVTKQGSSEPTTRLQASYESYNTQDFWLQHGGRYGDFNVYLTGSYRRSNGFPLSDDFSPALHENGGLAEQSEYEKYNVAMNLGYEKTPDDKIALVVGYYQAELDVPPNIFGGGTGRRRLRFTRFSDWKRFNIDTYGQTKPLENLMIKGNIYFDRFSDDLIIFTDGTYSTVDSKSRFLNTSFGANLQTTWELSEDLFIKGGTFLKYDKHADKFLSGPSRRTDDEALTTDYFVEGDWAPYPWLQLSAGLNYDVMYTGGGRTIESWNPRASMTLLPQPNTRLRLGIGKKSRLPRLLNLFAGRGNLQLEPENNFVIEAGANQLFWNGRIEADVVWFRNDVDHMIVFRPTSGGRTQDQNAISFVSHGIESVLTAHITNEAMISLDYTYIDQAFENRGDDVFNDGYHQLNTRVAYQPAWGLGVFLQGSYVKFGDPSKPKISSTVGEDTFFLLNGKISYAATDYLTPYVAVENILDTNYSRLFGFPQPGRRFFFGLSARF